MADDDTTPDDDTGKTDVDPSNLPDSHPLVKAYKATKADLATARTKLQGIEDEGKTEIQRLQDSITAKDQELAELPKTVRKQAIAFASAATKAGFLDPEDALVFIDVDLSDPDAVKTALEELAERKPHLVSEKKAPKKLASRPKAKAGGKGDEDVDDDLTGKERAAAALRQFSTTR